MPEPAGATLVLHEPAAKRWLVFAKPRQVLTAAVPSQVLPVLAAAERAVQAHGLFAAGFLAYEAAPGLDPALETRAPTDFPLAWFGLFDPPAEQESLPETETVTRPLDWACDATPAQYAAAVHRIKDYIRAGDTYQVNYSVRLRAAWEGDPWPLFQAMVRAQGPHYAAFLQTEAWAICSASPELFFELRGDRLVSRPMKGTAPRALWPAADAPQGEWLRQSEKNRAENVMIVDMVRNDLGRVARPGSVQVERLFEVERYPTLWQMTSTVACATPAPVADVFRALFPPASITGAPKVRTMRIIAELESAPRQIYTGAIGFIAPHRRAQFNVAIRTLLVNRRAGAAEYGVGGGIVWDSAADLEYEECRWKRRILDAPPAKFDLIETMLWEPGAGYHRLDLHLARLAASADYFDWEFSPDALRQALAQFESQLPAGRRRVRVTLSAAGRISLSHGQAPPAAAPVSVALAANPIVSTEPRLYHKTTDRRLYEAALAARPGFDDVLLWNERGEVTESTIANLVVEKGGELLTPPIHCGLLPGTARAALLEDNRVREAVVRVRDLPECSRLFLINAVRGMREARLLA